MRVLLVVLATLGTDDLQDIQSRSLMSLCEDLQIEPSITARQMSLVCRTFSKHLQLVITGHTESLQPSEQRKRSSLVTTD